MRVLACALLVITTAHAASICEPGDTIKDGKNECFCIGDGDFGWVCAPLDGRSSSAIAVNRQIETEERCQPEEFFNDYCNTCHCGPDGKSANAVCTMMACDLRVWNKDGTKKDMEGTEKNLILKKVHKVSDFKNRCKPGKIFRYYCNECLCGKNGVVACTEKACDTKVWNEDGTKKTSVNLVHRSIFDDVENCEPGKTFKRYCNSCICGKNGVLACTAQWCDVDVWNKDGTMKDSVKVVERPLPDEFKTCKPGETFKDYCNTCTCGTNGQAACTKMACDPEIWNKDGTPKNIKDVAQNPLLRETREVEDVDNTCKPLKPYKYYCNSCFCGREGKITQSVCTKMACDPAVWNRDGTRKNIDEIAQNPLLRQARDVEDEEETCTPGENFKYYCNSCRCGPEGKVGRAACTMMRCIEGLWNKDGTPKNPLLREAREVEDKEETCEPGKQFKYYCNNCFCGPDGKVSQAPCTKMACDHDIWNKDGSLKYPNEIANNPLLRKPTKVEDNDDTCEPGKEFKYYCNSCFCGPEGKISDSICTRMACDHNIWNRDGTVKTNIASNPLLRKEQPSNFICQPGRVFKDDCNTCFCSPDGKGAGCTYMSCPPRGDGRVVAPQVCEPGSNFMIECNRCACNNDGTKIACTKMACHSVAKRSVCEPNSTFKKDCNECKCNSDGTYAACTLRACDASPKKVCEPNTTFKKDCNDCTCNADGTYAACTLRACHEVAKRSVCEPNSTFKKDCNECKCNSDGTYAACTLRACDASPKKVCEPNTTFKKDCNDCTCNADGTYAACTLRACHQVAKRSVCEPNSTFKKDCNDCKCNSDGTYATCTMRLCPRVAKRSVCEPNSTFKKDCNDCKCNSDGTYAACTLRACHQVAKRSVCEPNSTFKKDCNECKCNSDGTYAACTLRACNASPKKVCEPNTIFKKDCNDCTCNADGTYAACTLRACHQVAKRSVCEPNSTFKKDCNDCKCNSDGTYAACTMRLCPRVAKRSVCEPNSTFKKDCNDCKCNSDGTYATCTMRLCPRVAKRSVCEPNSTFKKDCNDCKCNSDGTYAACTLRACN